MLFSLFLPPLSLSLVKHFRELFWFLRKEIEHERKNAGERRCEVSIGQDVRNNS